MRTRKKRHSRVVALAGAFIASSLLLCVQWLCAVIIAYAAISAVEAIGWRVTESVLLGYSATVAALMIVFSFIGSRAIYRRLRWRTIESTAPLCLKCDYNLTGNVSGICPECGEPVPDASADPQ